MRFTLCRWLCGFVWKLVFIGFCCRWFAVLSCCCKTWHGHGCWHGCPLTWCPLTWMSIGMMSIDMDVHWHDVDRRRLWMRQMQLDLFISELGTRTAQGWTWGIRKFSSQSTTLQSFFFFLPGSSSTWLRKLKQIICSRVRYSGNHDCHAGHGQYWQTSRMLLDKCRADQSHCLSSI